MSAAPNPKVEKKMVEETAVTQVPPVQTEEVSKPIVIKTELDAYISERVKGQPVSLNEVISSVQPRTELGRMSLPDELEKLSYDCTVMNPSCKFHLWSFDEERRRWSYTNRGQFIFRWLAKNKRALDEAMDVKEWVIVNRQLFPQLQKYMVSANGIVERGSAILAFMSVEKALRLRTAPGQKSADLVKRRITNVSKPGEEPRYMLNPTDPIVAQKAQPYMPRISKQVEGEDESVSTEGLQPDKDF